MDMGVQVDANRNDYEFERDDDESPRNPEALGDFRLAWMFVEGWRQRLRVAGDIVEKNRWEWRFEDMRSASRLSFAASSMAALRTVPGGVATTSRTKKKKSVHWAF
jgi:hypothetical protein